MATIKTPSSGLYPVSFTVVDYQNQGLQKVGGVLRITELLGAAAAPPGDKGFGKFLPELFLFLLLALILLAIVKYMYKKLNEKLEERDRKAALQGGLR